MYNKLSSAEELSAIRKMMEESTKFLSISGFSGVLMGLIAIAGAVPAWFMINKGIVNENFAGLISLPAVMPAILSAGLIFDAVLVLILSLSVAFLFSLRKAKRSGRRFLTPVSRRLLLNLFIPLVTGGLLAIILLNHGINDMIIPVLLIFYGLGLISAGKFTYDELFYLGLLEIITGLTAAYFPFLGLLFWIIGFGLFHILYGIFMYRKYEA